LVVEWHLSTGNVNVDLSLVLDGYPVAGVNAVARDLWFGVGGAAVNYATYNEEDKVTHGYNKSV
jgi:hypothetical protein